MKNFDIWHCLRCYYFEGPNICKAKNMTQELKGQAKKKCPDFYATVRFMRYGLND